MPDSTLKRFGVSMEGNLLQKFDDLILQKGYANRSEAVRDLVREALFQQSLETSDQIVAGSILLFYDHHQRNLQDEMTKIQHELHHLIIAVTHFHLDHDSCLEIIVVKGKIAEVQQLGSKLTSLKGVEFGRLTIAPVSKV